MERLNISFTVPETPTSLLTLKRGRSSINLSPSEFEFIANLKGILETSEVTAADDTTGEETQDASSAAA